MQVCTCVLRHVAYQTIFAAVCFQFLELCGKTTTKKCSLEMEKKWKKQNRDKKNVGRKETFIDKLLGICLIWNLPVFTLLWKRRTLQTHEALQIPVSKQGLNIYCESFLPLFLRCSPTDWAFERFMLHHYQFLESDHHRNQTSWSNWLSE